MGKVKINLPIGLFHLGPSVCERSAGDLPTPVDFLDNLSWGSGGRYSYFGVTLESNGLWSPSDREGCTASGHSFLSEHWLE